MNKYAGIYDSLVNQAIACSKLSPATKLMGSSAQNAIKVLNTSAGSKVKAFSPILSKVKSFK